MSKYALKLLRMMIARRPTAKSKRGARLLADAARSAHLPMEALESRILLSGTTAPMPWLSETPAIIVKLPPRTATTTVVTSSANHTVFGQAVTFTATVTSNAGTPTGTVQFVINGKEHSGLKTLVDGTFTAEELTGLPAGTDKVFAVYSGVAGILGVAGFATSTSATITQTVTKADTTTAIAASANPSVTGQFVVFTATVSPVAPGGGTPTGTVQFEVGGSKAGGAVTLHDGVAQSAPINILVVGNVSIEAVYSGSTNSLASTGTLMLTINKDNTTTIVKASPDPSVSGQTVTFRATVTANTPGAGTPTGAVQFEFDGGGPVFPLATLVNGVATLRLEKFDSVLGAGNDSVIAIYSGNAGFNTSTSATLLQTVNQDATSTTLKSSAASSVSGQAVTFTATVAANSPGADTPTGTVQFEIDGSDVGSPVTLSSGKATTTINDLGVANHTVTAVYSGDSNFIISTSSTIAHKVTKAASRTVVISSLTPSIHAQSVSFTATVTPKSPGGGTPTGTVQFKVDGVDLGTPVTLVDGTATSEAISTLTVGTHSVTAVYSGSAEFDANTSAALTQTVDKDASAVVDSDPIPSTSDFGSALHLVDDEGT